MAEREKKKALPIQKPIIKRNSIKKERQKGKKENVGAPVEGAGKEAKKKLFEKSKTRF